MNAITCERVEPEAKPLEGEVLGPDEAAHIVYSPSAFKRANARVVRMKPGATLQDAVDATGVGRRMQKYLRVDIGDYRIERPLWAKIRPKPNAVVYIRTDLAGGEDEDGEKNPWRTVLMIVVAIIAIWSGNYYAGLMGFAEGSFAYYAASAVITSGVMMAGQALVNAIIPPPKIKSKHAFDQQPGNPYASITGIRNQMTPYGPIPRVMGKRKLYPVLAARPYTENIGSNQFLLMLLLVGYGPLRITELSIGNTPIGAFPGTTYQIREGWPEDLPQTLYTKLIDEEQLAVLLEYNIENTRTSQAGATELSIDIGFPQGLATIDKQSGQRGNKTVEFEVVWSVKDAGVWRPAAWIDGRGDTGTAVQGKIIASNRSTEPTVRSGRFPVYGGDRYDVRIKRLTTNATNTSVVDIAYFSCLRSIRNENPVNMSGVTLIALRMKATEQLHGAPDTINCVAESYLPVYHPNTQDWTTELTRNPAWETLDLLRRRGQSTMIADERIDLDAFAEYAAACDLPAPASAEPYWQADLVLEGGAITTAAQVIASTGRAQLALVDGRYSVVRDTLQSVPVQVITSRNSWGYRGFRAFVDIPHAFRVTFYNPNKGFQLDEVVVYRDGYGATAGDGVVAATKFETLDMVACASPDQAYREARYHFAVLLLRPDEHMIYQDIENIRCVKGSFVRFSHDVIAVGLSSGRIVFAEINEADEIVSITVDNAVAMEADIDYVVRIRHADYSNSLIRVINEVGEDQAKIRFETPIPLVAWPLASGAEEPGGEIYTFGVLGIETMPAKVKMVQPGPNLTARLTLVDDQEGVHFADQGAIPPFETHISRDVPIEQLQPPQPTITLRSDEGVLLRNTDGTLADRLEITHQAPPPSEIMVTQWEAQTRPSGGSNEWLPRGRQLRGSPIYVGDVVAGELYDVRARFLSKYGVPSEWTESLAHEIVGKTTPPGPVTGFAGVVQLTGTFIAWTAPVDSYDIVAYEVRWKGSDWDTSELIGTVPHVRNSTSQYTIADIFVTGGETLRIKVIDAIGLQSTEVTATVQGTSYADDGSIFDWRGLPTNGLGGTAVTRDGPSITGGGAFSINVGAVTLTVPGEGAIALPSATLSGLTGATKYWVFYDRTNNDYDAEDDFGDASDKMADNTGNFFYCGSRTTGGSTGSSGSGEIP